MSQKRIAELVRSLPGDWVPPSAEALRAESLSILEVGLVCVLMRRMSESAAQRTLKALRTAFPDWNEIRISQVQEFEGLIKSKSPELSRQVAADVREFLQEVFLKNHGFDLEFLREDPAEGAKLVSQLVWFGAGPAHYLLWYASGGEAPVSTGLIRVLDRAGLMKRTSSLKKASEEIAKLVPLEDRPLFAVRFGALVEHCDPKKPVCWECALVVECPFGKRVHREWQAAQKRLAVQRKREEEARRKAEERERKRAEAEARKRTARLAKDEARKRRADEKKRREAERKAKAEAARKAALEAKQKEAAQKKAAAKKAAEKKKAEARKKAAAKKAAAKKKAAKKKKTTKRSTTRKKATTKRSTTKRKPTAKRSTTKRKSTSRRGTTRKKAKSIRRAAGAPARAPKRKA